MMLSFVIKPYAIEVYSGDDQDKVLLGTELMTRILDEPTQEYEQRMIFVCKELAQDAKKHVKGISSVEVILSYPWCTYEHVDIQKELPEHTVITPKLLDSLRIQKTDPVISLLESSVIHVLLNGYTVPQILGQRAKQIEMQVLNVYTKTSCHSGLQKVMETIFHTHDVRITSIYSHALREARGNGLLVTLEEESVDISYCIDGKIALNVFIPTSYSNLEQNLMSILNADADTIRSILMSRALHEELSANPVDETVKTKSIAKTMQHLWPDLHPDVQKQINDILEDHYSHIMKYIYTMIDQLKHEYTFSKEKVRICALNKRLAKAYGFALARHIQHDGYIEQTMHIDDSCVFIDYLF